MPEDYEICANRAARKIDNQSKDIEKAYQEELIAICGKWSKVSLWQRIKRWFTRSRFDDLYPFKSIEEKQKAISDFRNNVKVQKIIGGSLVKEIPIKDLITKDPE